MSTPIAAARPSMDATVDRITARWTPVVIVFNGEKWFALRHSDNVRVEGDSLGAVLVAFEAEMRRVGP